MYEIIKIALTMVLGWVAYILGRRKGFSEGYATGVVRTLREWKKHEGIEEE